METLDEMAPPDRRESQAKLDQEALLGLAQMDPLGHPGQEVYLGKWAKSDLQAPWVYVDPLGPEDLLDLGGLQVRWEEQWSCVQTPVHLVLLVTQGYLA